MRLLLALLCALDAFGSLSASTQWDVRTTADDLNGGGFNVASAGTDASQSDAPLFTYTDLVIGGTTTQLSSAARPFVATDRGNILNVTGGTGFTVTRFQVVSVSGGVATMDAAVGTGGSTAGAGRLGGALASIPALNAAAACSGCGQTLAWIKSGTYTLTSVVDIAGGSGATAYTGYASVHGDFGTRPLITTATNSTVLFSVGGGQTFTNIAFTSTAGVKAVGFFPTNGAVGILFARCILSGFLDAINGDNAGAHFIFTSADVIDSEISGNTNRAVGTLGPVRIVNSYIHNNGSTQDAVLGSTVTLIRSVLANNTGDGAHATGTTFAASLIAVNVDAYANGRSGLEGQGIVIENSILYGNTRYGAEGTVAVDRLNAFGANTLGDISTAAAASGDFSVTNPFVDASTGNWRLNGDAGAGALLRAAGYPGLITGTTGTGSLDIGAVQTPAGGAFAFAAP